MLQRVFGIDMDRSIMLRSSYLPGNYIRENVTSNQQSDYVCDD